MSTAIGFTREQAQQYLRQRDLVGRNWITLEAVDDFNRELSKSKSGFFICFSNSHTPPAGWRWGWVEGQRGVVLRKLDGSEFIARTDVDKWSPKSKKGDC